MSTSTKPPTSAPANHASAAAMIRSFPIRFVWQDPDELNLTGPMAIIYALFRTMLDYDSARPNESARVQAARELADRLWGKVPVIEHRRVENSLADLDLSELSDRDAGEFRRILGLALAAAQKKDV